MEDQHIHEKNNSSPGVASDKTIMHHLQTTGDIVIYPFQQDQLSTSSYDVTLGEWYSVENPEQAGKIFNPWNPQHINEHWLPPQKAFVVSKSSDCYTYGCELDDKIIIIQPNETILAHTNEFIGGRRHITTMMKARSSMGRCGVSVCKCAGWGDVGYINRWTMEIQNATRRPIVLIVGQKIAQIVFFETGDCLDSYETKGSYQTESAEDLTKVISTWKPTDIIPRIKRVTDRTLDVESLRVTAASDRLPVATIHTSKMLGDVTE